MNHCIQRLSVLLAGLAYSLSIHANTPTICIFDLGGTSGDTYILMKDFALQSQKWGVPLQLSVYAEETEVIRAFQQQDCQGMVLTDIAARQFNRFVGSMNAVGAIPNYRVARAVYQTMLHPKLEPYMTEGRTEVAGVVPMGLVYSFSQDRQYVATLGNMMGKRIGVLDTDPLQSRLIKRIGAQPIPQKTSRYQKLFNQHLIDILPAPVVAYSALELEQGLGEKGGVSRFPLLLLSQVLIVDPSAFPQGYGQWGRGWMHAEVPRLLRQIDQHERSVPPRRWVDIPASDQLGYRRLMREMRVNFIQESIYDRKMLTLIKRVRCALNPQEFDCGMTGE